MASIAVRTRDNFQLSVQVWGDPAGPEILFLHGFNQCHLSWSRQYTDPALLACRLVTFDLRGHGASDKPTTAESYQDDTLWAADVAAVMEATGLKKPVAVAWSYAGRVITDYVRHHGTSRLAGINFVDASLITDSTMVGPDRRHLLAMLTDDLVTNIDSTMNFLRACFVIQPSAEEFQKMLAFNMVTSPAIRKLIVGRSVNEGDMLARIDVPTLLTHGTEDRLLLPSMSRFAATKIPHAQLSLYEGVGHSPFHEQVARYNAELLAFVKAANAR